jgi:hypothetical protein
MDQSIIQILGSINRNRVAPYFVKEHIYVLSNIYNNIFKDYHDILDFDTFVSFALDKSTQNVRLYKN